MLNQLMRDQFREMCEKHIDRLIQRLAQVLDTPFHSHLRIELLRLMAPNNVDVVFDKEFSYRKLTLMLTNSPHIYGISNLERPKLKANAFPINLIPPETVRLQESSLVTYKQQVIEHYWKDELRLESFKRIKNFPVHENRDAQSTFEKINSTRFKDGFFNVSGWIQYYTDLFALFFSDYPQVSDYSTKSIRRFIKPIVGKNLFIGFEVNIDHIASELKKHKFPNSFNEIYGILMTDQFNAKTPKSKYIEHLMSQ